MSTATINIELQRIIRLIPNYDPYAQAGDCRFDDKEAEYAIGFIETCCTFSQGSMAGKSFILEDWQKAIVANLFGWRRPNNTRRYRKMLLFLGRANGKSELAAAIICFILFTEQEAGAQIYSAAAKRDQTRFIFDPVRKMIAASAEMSSRAGVFKRSIVVEDRSYMTISREATTEHGGSTHLAVFDELHAQPDRELLDVIETSMIKRTEPLLLMTTTSDFERESVCNTEHEYASKVAQNSIDRGLGIDDMSYLPVIYEATLEDDWESPEVWRKANPNLGVSIQEEKLRVLATKAREMPTFLNTFLRLHLNVRTSQDVRLIPMDQWDNSSQSIDLESLKGKQCWGGLDLSTLKDLSALSWVFRDDSNDVYTAIMRFFCPRDEAMKRDKAGVPYMTWARQGLITLTDGNSIDYRTIRKQINDDAKLYKIQEIGFDPYNASHLVTELGEEDGFTMVEVRQGMLSMSPPTKELLRLLQQGAFRHGGNAVLRWNASNVSGKTDSAENVKPDKKTSNEKIDGIVAAIVALSRAMVAGEKPGSFYDTHDVRVL